MNGNFIFISPDKWDKPIYRIFPIHRFLEILNTQKLTLVKPKLWDDPFENYFLSANVQFSDGKSGVIGAREAMYAQCWTWHRESDAMWRIYSPNKDGIRVSTTPRKLLEALHSQIGEFAKVRGYIGQVEYVPKKRMRDIFQKINILDTSGRGLAESLLYKRVAFRHESEVRLIYHGYDDSCEDNVYGFDINPSELFDILLFDPRINPYLKEAYKTKIAELGFDFKYKRSTLYDLPEELTLKV